MAELLVDDNLEGASVEEQRRRTLQRFEQEERRLGLIPEPEVSPTPFRMPALLAPEAPVGTIPDVSEAPPSATPAPADVVPPGAMQAELAPVQAQAQREQGLLDLPPVQIIGGIRDMFVNTMQGIHLMGNWMRERGWGPRGFLQIRIPEIPKPVNVPGQITRGAAQFLSAFGLTYLGLPSLRALGAASGSSTVIRAALRGEISGVVADLAAFDGHEPRMSNLLKQLPPALGGPLFAYLSADPTDTEAEGRFKNALEGVLAGATLQGFFLAGRLVVRSTFLRGLLQRGRPGPLADAASQGDEAIDTTAPAMAPQTVGVRQGDSWMDVPMEKLTAEPRTVQSAAARQAQDFVEARGLTEAIPGVDIPPRAGLDVPASVPREALPGDVPVIEPPAISPTSQVRTPQGDPLRVFHGSPRAFTEFSLEQADEGALLGPGIYFTDNPQIAGGTEASALGFATANLLDPQSAPNVRAAFLNIDEIFDMDKPLLDVQLDALEANAPREVVGLVGDAIDSIAGRQISPTGQEFFDALVVQFDGDKVGAQEVLKLAGFDGMTLRAGTEPGEVAHQVYVVFDPRQVVSSFDPPRAGLDVPAPSPADLRPFDTAEAPNAALLARIAGELSERMMPAGHFRKTDPPMTVRLFLLRAPPAENEDLLDILRETGADIPDFLRTSGFTDEIVHAGEPRPLAGGSIEDLTQQAEDLGVEGLEIPVDDVLQRLEMETVIREALGDVPPDLEMRTLRALSPQEMAEAMHRDGLLAQPSVSEMTALLQEKELVPQPLPTGRKVPDIDAELQTVIRNHRGIKLTEGETGIETELRDLIGIREGGRANVSGLLNNQSGMSPQAMAEVLHRSGHIATADTAELLAGLDRSTRQGQPVISNFNTAYLERELYQDDALARQWRELKTLQENWDNTVAIQRRTLERTEAEGGSRAAARTEAEALRSGQPMGPGLPPGEISLSWIKRMNPGATMNDAQAIALIDTIVEASQRTVRAAAHALETESRRDVTTALTWLHMQGEMQPKSLGVVTELGRSLSAMNDPTKAYNVYLQQFEDLFATQRNMTPRQFMEKLASVKSIEELQQMAQRTTNLLQDGRLAGGSRLTNALLDVWTASILSSPMGRLADITSNVIVAAMAVPERQLAALYGDVPVGEATQLGYGMLAEIPAAFRVLGEVLARGENAATLRGRPTKFEVHQVPIETDQAAGLFTRGVEYVGGALRGTVGRVMLGADEFASSVTGAGQMRALAYRQAVVDEGLRGADAWRRVNAILGDPGAGLEGAGAAFGLETTMRAPLGLPPGVPGTLERPFARLGMSGQRFQDVMMRIPALRLVAPFVRTPTNLLIFALERTPAALMSSQVRNALRRGGPEASMTMAKIQLGTGLLTTAALLASQGILTGRGPSNPKLRQQWLNTHQPYSIKVGNTWQAYQRLDPYGMLLGLAADFQNLAGEMLDQNPEGADRLAVAALAAIWTNLSSKTYVQGLSRLFDALNTSSPGATIRDLERLTTNIAVGFIPFSGALGSATRATDNVRRRRDGVSFFDTLYRTAAARIPGWAETLPPYRNVWGDPVLINGGWAQRMTSPIYTKDATPNPLDDELLRLQFPLTLPPRSLHAGDQLPGFEPPSGTRAAVRLSPEQWDQYILFQAGVDVPGPTLRERGAALLASPGYASLPDGAKRGLWHDMLYNPRDGARTLARIRLLAKFPELRQKIALRQRELQTLGMTGEDATAGREALTNRLRATQGTSSIPRMPRSELQGVRSIPIGVSP